LWFYVISETFPQANLLAWYGKKLNLTQQKHAFTNHKNVLQHKINTKKLKPGLVAFYDIRPGNREGLVSKEKTSRGRDKQGKSEEKTIRGEAYDINKQTMYIAPKSKIKPRAPLSPQYLSD